MAEHKSTDSVATETVGADQMDEVSVIKAAFPNRCRVSSDDKEFSQVITVQPENMDATIKFQLPFEYPAVIPEIIIRSESLSQENINIMRQMLMSKAKETVGQPMTRLLIAEAESLLKTLGLKPGKTVQLSTCKLHDNHKQKKMTNKRIHLENEVQDSKLPPMKTSDDVVKRIIWDDMLDKNDFTVGYVDRFKGLLEKCFSDFSWEDLASVDYDVFAIPKHRIQYFKYKNVKVWDKTKRVDNVFGSAEGTKTIDIVIKELQELEHHSLKETNNNFENNALSEENNNSDNSIDIDYASSPGCTDLVVVNS